MGLLSALLLIMTQIFVTVLEGQISAETTSAVAQDGRFIYSRFIHDIHQAQSVSTPLSLGDTSSSLIFTQNALTYTYSLVNGNLMLTDPSGSYQLNSFNSMVRDLQFQRVGNVNGKHTFRITFVIEGRGGVRGDTQAKQFQTTVGLR
jgi:hypothetical protein